MGKKILVLFLLGLTLVGCSNAEQVLDSNIPTEIVEIENDEVSKEEVILTEEKKKKIKDKLSKNTELEFIIENRSGVYDELVDTLYTVQYYNVIVDIKNKVTSIKISDIYNSDNISNYSDFYYVNGYISDLKKNKYYYSESSDIWVKEKGTTKVLDWDLKNYNNVNDLYNYFLKDIDIDTKGFIDSNLEVYQTKIKANENMLKGIDYDNLCECIYSLKIKDNIPISIETKVIYEKKGIKYYCSKKIKFNEMSKKGITLKMLGIE